MMDIETDIVVVGAGPAGSLAAREAAIHGADVLLIDKKAEIGSPKDVLKVYPNKDLSI